MSDIKRSSDVLKLSNTVMVVDDNPANLEVVVKYLQANGMETAIAGDGEIALKRAKYLTPDLILLDILMPGIDGIETCRMLKADGETRDIPVIFMTSLTDRDHKTKGFSAGGVDYVTKPIQHQELLARVKTHLEIQRYRKHLEKEVKKRTVELETRTAELEAANKKLKDLEEERIKSEALLRQAQKMEAIGTLAGGIAHDFNNMLSPIIGYVEMAMQDMPPDDNTLERLNKVLSAANRAKDLVMQILNFSRQTDYELKPLKVQSIISEVLKLIKSTFPTTIEIHRDIDDQCGAVVADSAKVHQIFMNLCTNAYHAMEDTGGILTVVLKEVELAGDTRAYFPVDSGAYICLEVSDTGIGMDARTIERIFDPYFTTKENGKGTGLGLAVVQGIINNLGGGIRVDSEMGKGSTFSVYLPVQHQVKDEKGKDPLPLEALGGNERILLVDDEPLVAGLEKLMLESLGYEVTASISSLDTLALFRKDPQQYDLIITDMTMPNMTGEQLAGEIVRIRPNMPVIICTGFSEKINDEKIKAMGARELVMKPFVKKELAQAVRRVLDL